jgi:hypothetical protein
MLEQRLGLVAIAGRDRDPDAHPDIGELPAKVERFAHGREQALAQPRRAARPGNAVLQDRELVGAKTREQVGFSQPGEQPGGGVAEQHVACNTAQGVVDRLEIGKIDPQHRRHAVMAAGAAELRVQTLEKGAAVRQTGKGVVAGEMIDPRFGRDPGLSLAALGPSPADLDPGGDRGHRQHRERQPAERHEARTAGRHKTHPEANEKRQRAGQAMQAELDQKCGQGHDQDLSGMPSAARPAARISTIGVNEPINAARLNSAHRFAAGPAPGGLTRAGARARALSSARLER